MRKLFASRLRSFIAALILLALFASPAGSAVKAARPVAAAPAPRSLSYEDRVEAFEQVWKAINEKYYDQSFNGANWKAVRERYRPMIARAKDDESFYNLLKDMVGELRDAHTRFHTPRERQERERLQSVSAGLSVFEVEGRPVVVSVAPGSEAESAGIAPGMIIRTIDGKPVAQRIAEARAQIGASSTERAMWLRLYRKILDGEPGTNVSLGLTRADGAQFDAIVPRRTIVEPPTVSFSVLPSGYGYVKLSMWKSPIHREFKAALETLQDTPGLIVDLRGNPGGEVNEVLKIASYFFSGRVYFGRFIRRSGKTLELFSFHNDGTFYNGSVVILINEGSGSGSEMFSGVLQENGRALVIGRQSCGCLLGISKYRKVRGGGEVAISELGYISPEGRKLEGTGVIPNEAVALKLADLQRHRDAALEEAENILRAPLKSSSSAH